MVHTPIHASWLNQVEIYYSIVQRKALSPNDFTDLAEVENRLAAFERRFNATAAPFNWTFTADDLDDLLARIDAHEHPDGEDTPLAQQAARLPRNFRCRPLSPGHPGRGQPDPFLDHLGHERPTPVGQVDDVVGHAPLVRHRCPVGQGDVGMAIHKLV